MKYQDAIIYIMFICITLLKSSVLICGDTDFCMYLISFLCVLSDSLYLF